VNCGLQPKESPKFHHICNECGYQATLPRFVFFTIVPTTGLKLELLRANPDPDSYLLKLLPDRQRGAGHTILSRVFDTRFRIRNNDVGTCCKYLLVTLTPFFSVGKENFFAYLFLVTYPRSHYESESVPLANGSGSCHFRQWPSRVQVIFLITFWRYILH
jgi:hypothetical protein